MFLTMVPSTERAMAWVSRSCRTVNPRLISSGRIFKARMYSCLAASSTSRMSTFTVRPSSSALHAPFANRFFFCGSEHHVFNQQTDDDDGAETGEDIGDFQFIFIFIDKPAESAGAGADAEYQFRGNQGAPG